MAAHRHPCVGDLTYGADPTLAKRLRLTRQWLHAVRLGFEHPGDGQWVEFESDYPDDLQQALDQVREETYAMSRHARVRGARRRGPRRP